MNMYRKIRFTSSLILFFCTVFFSSLAGQDVIHFSTVQPSAEANLVYSSHFKTYSLGSLNTETVNQLLRSKSYFSDLKIQLRGNSFAVNLQSRDIRPAHYKLRYQDDLGTHEMPRSPNKTYSGFTKTGSHDVRITADTQFFYALIEQDGDEFYIEPAQNIYPAAAPDHFIMYWASDNLKSFSNESCGVTGEHLKSHNHDDGPPPADNRNG